MFWKENGLSIPENTMWLNTNLFYIYISNVNQQLLRERRAKSGLYLVICSSSPRLSSASFHLIECVCKLPSKSNIPSRFFSPAFLNKCHILKRRVRGKEAQKHKTSWLSNETKNISTDLLHIFTTYVNASSTNCFYVCVYLLSWNGTESNSTETTLLVYCPSLRWELIIIVEKSVEWMTDSEIEVPRENLPQCGSIHHRSGLEIWPPRWEAWE